MRTEIDLMRFGLGRLSVRAPRTKESSEGMCSEIAELSYHHIVYSDLMWIT